MSFLNKVSIKVFFKYSSKRSAVVPLKKTIWFVLPAGQYFEYPFT